MRDEDLARESLKNAVEKLRKLSRGQSARARFLAIHTSTPSDETFAWNYERTVDLVQRWREWFPRGESTIQAIFAGANATGEHRHFRVVYYSEGSKRILRVPSALLMAAGFTMKPTAWGSVTSDDPDVIVKGVPSGEWPNTDVVEKISLFLYGTISALKPCYESSI